MGTGRSDYPNQVNNVLCFIHFPWCARCASEINDEMKLAAVKAIRELAKEEVPAEVLAAAGETRTRSLVKVTSFLSQWIHVYFLA